MSYSKSNATLYKCIVIAIIIMPFYKIFGGVIFTILSITIFMGFLYLKNANKPVCRHCKNKCHYVYKHRCVDGSPDRRYHNNYLICNLCGVPQSKPPLDKMNLP